MFSQKTFSPSMLNISMLPFIIVLSNAIIKLPDDGLGETTNELEAMISFMPFEVQSVFTILLALTCVIGGVLTMQPEETDVAGIVTCVLVVIISVDGLLSLQP